LPKKGLAVKAPALFSADAADAHIRNTIHARTVTIFIERTRFICPPLISWIFDHIKVTL
jgi:hypothetical protein